MAVNSQFRGAEGNVSVPLYCARSLLDSKGNHDHYPAVTTNGQFRGAEKTVTAWGWAPSRLYVTLSPQSATIQGVVTQPIKSEVRGCAVSS